MAGGFQDDAWRERIDRSGMPAREPGPIELNRYIAPSGAYAGIPTFMGFPVALTPEDLVAGDVDIAVMGAPVDMTVARRGASWGPRGLRTAEQYIPWGAAAPAFPHQGAGIKPFDILTCVDYGDIGVDPFDIQASHDEIRRVVREVIEAGTIPFVIGGDHSLMNPDVKAMADVYGPGNVGVIHFDAHHDAVNNVFGHGESNGSMVYKLIEEDHLQGKNFVQIGMRGWVPTDADFEWMRAKEIKTHYMAEIERDGFPAVAERAIAEAMDGPEYLFISFDVDSLDPAYMPGTGSPEPGGLTTREVFPIVRRLCAETNVVGFELVEVAPLLDASYTTAFNALRVMQEAMTGIAMRKVGLTEPYYLDPKRSGQDPVPGQRTD